MTADQYQRLSEPLRQRPAALKALLAVNKLLTLLGYVAFPALLVFLYVTDNGLLLNIFVTSAIAFVLVTAARKLINAQRPYEALDIQPLIEKDTKGQSFPSRHAFSFMIIALGWLAVLRPVGIVLVLVGFVLSAVRVIGGVHFIKDVLAGMLVALAAALLGGYFF